MKRFSGIFFSILLLSLFLFTPNRCFSNEPTDLKIEIPDVIMTGIPVEIKVSGSSTNQYILINHQKIDVPISDNHNGFPYVFEKTSEIAVKSASGEVLFVEKIRPIPAWLSLLPPLIAIILALVFREVIISLFLGIYAGALIPAIYGQGIAGFFTALLVVIDHYIIQSLNDAGHLSVVIFSMLIGATVGVISKNGGMQGVVNALSVYAKSRKSGQFITWLLGVLIFFDDYANTLVVGNTMRPVTDKLKISREKLSYIVDSTAAPIAAIAFVTTWIGAELGYIQDGIERIEGLNMSAYGVFLQSLQYSFYPILTLIFILFIIKTGKDFGPMLTAEKNNLKKESISSPSSGSEMLEFQPNENIIPRSYNAVIPILTIVLGTLAGLVYTGWDPGVWDNPEKGMVAKLSAIVGNSDPYVSLLWSSLCGLIVATGLSLFGRILTVNENMNSIMTGFKTMLTAMVILVLAWSLSTVTDDLQTAEFLSGAITGQISPALFPAITFIISALVAFATGSSWGSMAILYPIMLTLSWSVCTSTGMEPGETLNIFLNVVSCVLAGSVLGDHCSPISDTTILSSLASDCHHIDHVRTQLPYALTVGIVSILLGTLPSAMGVPVYICFPVAIIVLYLTVNKIGKAV